MFGLFSAKKGARASSGTRLVKSDGWCKIRWIWDSWAVLDLEGVGAAAEKGEEGNVRRDYVDLAQPFRRFQAVRGSSAWS